MGSWRGGYMVMDPADIEARFSNDHSLGALCSMFREHLDEEEEEKLDKIREAMKLIPKREADFIDLYVFKNRRQTEIAAIFGVSQPTVSYRLKRAASRIQFLLQKPDVSLDRLQETLERVLPDSMDREIMLLMLETTCQSEVAKRLGVTQGLVRHRFIRALNKLEAAGGCDDCVVLFRTIHNNLNILREVHRNRAKEEGVIRVLG